MSLSRRNFLRQSMTGVTVAAAIPAIVASCVPNEKKHQNTILKKGDNILFQGDSITDAGRDRNRKMPNTPRAFGAGYAFIAASSLMAARPELDLTVYNRGISGNKVYQLAERWQEDCIDLKPSVLSILIGVNDYWHLRSGRYDGTVEIYENDFRTLLQQTMEKLPSVKLVVGQPFAVPGTSAVDESWIEPLKGYQEAAHKLAKEFKAIWIPYQEVFDEAINHAPATYWTADGVHPSIPGSQLMAEAWLKSIG